MSYPDKNSVAIKVEIRESVLVALGIISLFIGLLSFLVYRMDMYMERIGLPVFVLILSAIVCYVLYRIYRVVRRKVILSIDNQGIYHKDYKLLKWDDILSIKKKVESGEENEVVFFLLQTTASAEPYKIKVTGLDISEVNLAK